MSTASILLVDDQLANLIALKAILEPLGHTPVCVQSGFEALKQILEIDFAVILLDVRMPGLDGYETAAMIRKRDRSANTPIIFLTADASDHDDILRAYDQGAVDFLGKPFEPTVLRAKVAIFVALYLQGEQLKQQSAALREQERAALRAEVARDAAERMRLQEQAHIERLENDRRAAELHAEALARVTEELARSNRELDQFAYVASHDIKAPLRGIASICTWLGEDLADQMTPETRKHLDLMQSRVERLGALVDGILAYSRVGRTRAQPEIVDIGAVVHDVVELLHAPVGASITVAEGMPVARVQKQLLAQVFSNLVGNAIKYARRTDPCIEVSAKEAGRFFEFSVSDNGPGIAASHHDRIWGLFQRLESRDEIDGAGIGLALVKKIVEGQGGRVWVESQAGHGATFRFHWPVEKAGSAGS